MTDLLGFKWLHCFDLQVISFLNDTYADTGIVDSAHIVYEDRFYLFI